MPPPKTDDAPVRSISGDTSGPRRMSGIHVKSSGRQILGSQNTIDGDDNTVRGNKNVINGERNRSKGDGVTMIGDSNYSFGNNVKMEGKRCTSLGESATFTGSNSTINSKGGTVDGDNNTIIGNGATVNGHNCKVTGDDCVIEGNGVRVFGNGVRVKGDDAVISGSRAVVEGKNCTINGTVYQDGYTEQMGAASASASAVRDTEVMDEALGIAFHALVGRSMTGIQSDFLGERSELSRVLAETENYGTEGATDPSLTWYAGDAPTVYMRMPFPPGRETNIIVNMDGRQLSTTYNHSANTGFSVIQTTDEHWRTILRENGRVPIEYTDGWAPSTSTGRSPTIADRKRAATARIARERRTTGSSARRAPKESVQMESALLLEKDDRDADDADDDSKTCQLCCEKDKCASAAPCGHIIGCGGCSVKLCNASSRGKVLCPVCRCEVASFCRVRL